MKWEGTDNRCPDQPIRILAYMNGDFQGSTTNLASVPWWVCADDWRERERWVLPEQVEMCRSEVGFFDQKMTSCICILGHQEYYWHHIIVERALLRENWSIEQVIAFSMLKFPEPTFFLSPDTFHVEITWTNSISHQITSFFKMGGPYLLPTLPRKAG